MPFKTSDVRSPAAGFLLETDSYSRVEVGKNGSRPSFRFVGTTKTERGAASGVTSGVTGWATGAAADGAAATGNTITHAANALLQKLTCRFI